MDESAAEILTRARLGAGLTQAQLAERAGVTQSVVSAYERGRREPALSTLRRLVDAADARLVIDVSPVQLRTQLGHVRSRRIELVAALGALGARDVRVFGSTARGDEHAGSDVDLLVRLDGDAGIFDLLKMRDTAERILGLPVDIVPESGLKAAVAADVLREAVPL